MAKRKKRKKIHSEAIFSMIIAGVLILLIGYYLYRDKLTEIQYTTIAPENRDTEPGKAKTVDIANITVSIRKMVPKSNSGNQVIHHFAYSLAYDEYAEQAEWVIYRMTDDYLLGQEDRSNNFKKDPLVETESATDDDYRHSGYDRGHLAPSADMKWNATAMEECFYMSNISPQDRKFNRVIWRSLETKVREWAEENDNIYVVVGPVLNDSLKKIGEDEVAVPEYFYKIVLDVSPPEYKGIGFIMRNKNTHQPLQSFAVSIDSVEHFTGIDFFYELPDSFEEALESKVDIQAWSF